MDALRWRNKAREAGQERAARKMRTRELTTKLPISARLRLFSSTSILDVVLIWTPSPLLLCDGAVHAWSRSRLRVAPLLTSSKSLAERQEASVAFSLMRMRTEGRSWTQVQLPQTQRPEEPFETFERVVPRPLSE